MKILIIHPWIRPGGAEQVCWHLAAQLEERGHSTKIASTFFDPDGLPEKAKDLDYALPPTWAAQLCRRSRTFFLIVGPWLLLALTWKHSRDADVLNPHNFPSAWIAAAVGALRKIPVVWTCNEPPERLNLRTGLKVGVADFLGWWLASSRLDRLFVKKVDTIHVLSERVRMDVARRYSRSAEIIPTPVDAPFWSGGKDKVVNQAFSFDHKFVLLSVGRLHPQKNQILGIEALEEVLPVVPNALLAIVGDGPSMQKLRNEAAIRDLEGHILFLPSVSDVTLRDLYGASSINLVCAINQSWGLTPFEALCAGTISVVSNETGASEVLSREGIGLVCQATSESFAQRILHVYHDPEFHNEIVQRGRDYVARNLTWHIFTDRLLDLMKIAQSDTRYTRNPIAGEYGVGP